MKFVIRAIDGEGKLEKRMEVRPFTSKVWIG